MRLRQHDDDERPAPDVWSPREYAWHMAGVFDFYDAHRLGADSSDGGERDIRNLASRRAHECAHHTLDMTRSA